MKRDRIPLHECSPRSQNRIQLETLHLKWLIESKYLSNTSFDFRAPQVTSCFSSQTNIPPLARRRYSSSLARASRTSQDSRSKGKIYSAMRHNRSLDEGCSISNDKLGASSVPIPTEKIQRILNGSKTDDLAQIASTGCMPVQGQRIRGLTPTSRKKRACIIPESSGWEVPSTNQVDEDSKIVNYYKSKYERDIMSAFPLSVREKTTEQLGQTPAIGHTKRRYSIKKGFSAQASPEICIEPW